MLNIAPSKMKNAVVAACENTELDHALFTRFVKYRLRLQDRVDYLQSENLQHENQRVLNDDFRMPSLLEKWSEIKKYT